MTEDNSSNQPVPAKPAPVRLAKGQEVNLGCGALILIAIIVMFCSGRGPDSREWKQELSSLQSEVKQLQKSVDDQTSLILQLKDQLDKLKTAK